MHVYEAIARRIADEGVRTVFGLMGDGNLKLIPCMTDRFGVSFYGARHEGGAVAMAAAYAQVTGTVGVCTVTQGPGLTNAMTALVSAQRGRAPLVLLCGNTPAAVPGLPQDIEQGPILAAAGIAFEEVTAGTAVEAVAAAFRRARTECRPIALDLPTDMQDEACEWHEPAVDAPAREAREPRADDLAAAVEAIGRARRPVVVAGRGAMMGDAKQSIVRFAEQAGALLATSLPAKSWFAGDPFDIGIAGGFASELGQRLIGDADCVIAFGASLNHFTSRGGTLFSSRASLVQCDVDPAAFGRFIPADVTVDGDARLVAERLTARIAQRTGYRTAEVRRTISEHRSREVSDQSASEALDPRTVSRRIDAMMPADRTLVVDGGHFMGFPSMFIDVPDPSRFVFTLDFGSIGLGVAAGVGAAAADRDRITVVAVGDGGLMMSLGELDTAVRYRLPLVVVVYNDQAYGAELHFLRMLGMPESEALFDVPPLDEVARALGGHGVAVRTLDDLGGVAELLDGLDRPLIVDCRISREVRAGWLEEAFQRGTH